MTQKSTRRAMQNNPKRERENEAYESRNMKLTPISPAATLVPCYLLLLAFSSLKVALPLSAA